MPVSEREVTSYINGWINTPQGQFAEELASLIHETKGIPDSYTYYITKNGELFSPTGQCKVKETIQDKASRLGQLEYQAVLLTEQLAASHNDGAIVWISPPLSGKYPTLKIIVSEIQHEGDTKKLFNRAILFDFNGQESLEFAQKLARYSQNQPIFSHPDQVRAAPLILNTPGNSWINILEGLIDDPALWISIRKGEDTRAKKETLRQATMVQKQLFPIMQMLGPKSPSCPPVSSSQSKTAVQVFSENAVTYIGSSLSKDPDFCKFCPVCGAQIDCIVRAGGSCPSCKAVKRCG